MNQPIILDKFTIKGRVYYLVQREQLIPSWEPICNLFSHLSILEQFEFNWENNHLINLESKEYNPNSFKQEFKPDHKPNTTSQNQIPLATLNSTKQYVEHETQYDLKTSESKQIQVQANQEAKEQQTSFTSCPNINEQQQELHYPIIQNENKNNESKLKSSIKQKEQYKKSIEIISSGSSQIRVENQNHNSHTNLDIKQIDLDTQESSSSSSKSIVINKPSKSIMQTSGSIEYNQDAVSGMLEKSDRYFEQTQGDNLGYNKISECVSKEKSRQQSLNSSSNQTPLKFSKQKISACVKSGKRDDSNSTDILKGIRIQNGQIFVDCTIDGEKQSVNYEVARERMTEQLLDLLLSKMKWNKVQK